MSALMKKRAVRLVRQKFRGERRLPGAVRPGDDEYPLIARIRQCQSRFLAGIFKRSGDFLIILIFPAPRTPCKVGQKAHRRVLWYKQAPIWMGKRRRAAPAPRESGETNEAKMKKDDFPFYARSRLPSS